MASNDRKQNLNLSNLNSPSKKPPTHRTNPFTIHRKKESPAKDEHGRESRRPKNQLKKNNAGDEILKIYPFVEGPVHFNFRDDYGGKRLFLEMYKELFYGIFCGNNYGRSRLILGAVGHSSGDCQCDVSALSSEADMIASFFNDGFL